MNKNTHNKCKFGSSIIYGLMLQLAALSCQAGIISYNNLEFESYDQGMWAPGSAPGFSIDQFLGVTWNESTTLGGITGDVFVTEVEYPHLHAPSGWECHGFLCTGGHFHNPGGIHIHTADLEVDTRTGAEVDVATNGKVGFQFGMSVDSGSVDTNVQMNANLFTPDTIQQGEFFNLNPANTLTAGQLATNFPELTVNLDAIVGVRASATGTACVPPFGCDTQSTGELGFADQTIPIVSFNDPDSPGQIKVLGQLDPALFQFDSEISIPGPSGGSLGGVTLHVPDINAVGGIEDGKLTAEGGDDLIKLTADLDGLALAPLGLPGGGVSFNAGILSASADLIDVDTGPIMTILQDFEFSPTLMVDLVFDTAVQIAGMLTPQTSWSGAWSNIPDIALLSETTLVTPTFFMEGEFTNQTGLGVDGIFQLDILKAAFSLEAFGLSFDLGEVGPMYQILQTTNLFESPPIFNESFMLGGFNQIQGESFLLSAFISVPGPGSLWLILLGIVLMLHANRRLHSTSKPKSSDTHPQMQARSWR